MTGVKGRRAAEMLKVSMSYQAGWKSSGSIVVCGPRALEKSKKFAEIFWERLGGKYDARLTEYMGHDAAYETGARIVRAYLDQHGISIAEAHRLPNEELYWRSGYSRLR